MRRTAGVVGVLLLVAGLTLGFVPQTSRGTDCGAVLHRSGSAQADDLYVSLLGERGTAAERCEDRLSLFRPLVWVALMLGVGVLAASVLPTGRPSRR